MGGGKDRNAKSDRETLWAMTTFRVMVKFQVKGDEKRGGVKEGKDARA